MHAYVCLYVRYVMYLILFCAIQNQVTLGDFARRCHKIQDQTNPGCQATGGFTGIIACLTPLGGSIVFVHPFHSKSRSPEQT